MSKPDEAPRESTGKLRSLVNRIQQAKKLHRKAAGIIESEEETFESIQTPVYRKRSCPWMLKIPQLREYAPKIAAEFLGTFIFVHTICFTINNQKKKTSELPSLVIGSCLMVLVYTFSPISGAHFNPAVSVAHCFVGEMDVIECTLYILTQLNGALISSYMAIWAAHLLKAEDSNARLSYGKFPKFELDKQDHSSALYLELFWTFVLVTVFFNVTLVPKKNEFFGVTIGFTRFIAASSVENLGSFNPAVCFGINLGHYFHQPFRERMPNSEDWVEIMIADLVGGILAGLLWRYVLGPAQQSSKEKHKEKQNVDDEKAKLLPSVRSELTFN